MTAVDRRERERQTGPGVARRHCMVVHAHYPLGETRVERQAQALVRAGYEVDILCLRARGEPAYEVDQGTRIYRLPVQRHKGRGLGVQLLEYSAFLLLAFGKLGLLYPRRRYGVVQVHTPPDWLVFAALLPKLGGARVILDIHDLMPEFFAGTHGTDLSSAPVRLLALQEKLSCRFADHVIAVTEHWRQTLVERGVPPAKTSVVMNVADDRIFRREPVSPRPSSNGAFRLIYHGALTERYGLALAIQAVDRLRERIPGLHLTIHGAGEFLDDLRAMVEQRALERQVTFSTQFVPTAQLPELIRQADCGLVPYQSNLFTDGILPTKLMECVALGVPVIAARTPAIAAYLDDDMVQFFPPGDAAELARSIERLWADRQRLVDLARASERFHQRYNWTTMAGEYVALVERLNPRAGSRSWRASGGIRRIG